MAEITLNNCISANSNIFSITPIEFSLGNVSELQPRSYQYSPSYLPASLPAHSSANFVINPSAVSGCHHQRPLVCKNNLTFLNNGMSVGSVTTETALAPGESDKMDIRGKAAFVYPQCLVLGPHHFWITAKASSLLSLPPVTYASNPS